MMPGFLQFERNACEVNFQQEAIDFSGPQNDR
jgi:hypothetical protein